MLSDLRQCTASSDAFWAVVEELKEQESAKHERKQRRQRESNISARVGYDGLYPHLFDGSTTCVLEEAHSTRHAEI